MERFSCGFQSSLTIPEDEIDLTLQKLGVSLAKPNLSPRDLIQSVKSGKTVHLGNSWRITQRKVSDEQRLKITGPDYFSRDVLLKIGIFTEKIGRQLRFFIPAEKNTIEIMTELLKISPVVWVTSDERKNQVKHTQTAETTRESGAAKPEITEVRERNEIEETAIKAVETFERLPETVNGFGAERNNNTPQRDSSFTQKKRKKRKRDSFSIPPEEFDSLYEKERRKRDEDPLIRQKEEERDASLLLSQKELISIKKALLSKWYS